jgi:hypothetical protein
MSPTATAESALPEPAAATNRHTRIGGIDSVSANRGGDPRPTAGLPAGFDVPGTRRGTRMIRIAPSVIRLGLGARLAAAAAAALVLWALTALVSG